MTSKASMHRERLLPTYRWDEWDERDLNPYQLSNTETELRNRTTRLLLDFVRNEDLYGRIVVPPESVIVPIVGMNVAKRTNATRQAEEMIDRGELTLPPMSLIPSVMASGHANFGVEDGYMNNDHPSQELFAYNRLSKKNWLNKKFGEHCMTAVSLTHANGKVEPAAAPTRVKAHTPTKAFRNINSGNDVNEWVVISSKTPIATVEENGRRAMLVSRVTGAVDRKSPALTSAEREAVGHLAERIVFPESEYATIVGQKALLLSALERHNETEENPFYPVIQTMYLTQLEQK